MARTILIVEPGKQEIVIQHTFDARRERVYQAYTDPLLIPRWWGLRTFTTTVHQMEVRPGGAWRFVHCDGGGNIYAFHGVYHACVLPERLVFTFEFEAMPGHVLLESVRFEDLEGKTKVTDQLVFQSVTDRDGMLHSGMEEGAPEIMDRLAELLARPAGLDTA